MKERLPTVRQLRLAIGGFSIDSSVVDSTHFYLKTRRVGKRMDAAEPGLR
jgi:hypothetical protein